MANPSDPRVLDADVAVGLRAALPGWQAGIWTALPGQIVDVDYDKQTVSVQPTIQGRVQLPDLSFKWIDMPILLDCPIVFPAGGGLQLTFPLVAGDEVLVVFASRCIDSWWQSSGVQVQAEMRMHDLSDGFAIPGPRSVPKANGFNSESAQLRTDDGTSYIELKPNGDVNVISAGHVNVKAVTSATIEAPTITLKGNVVVEGDVDITGAVVASGEVTAADFGSPGALVKYNEHKHVAPGGGGYTGLPLP